MHDQLREQYLQKPLPSDKNAERACIGGVIMDGNLVFELIGSIAPEEFYTSFHKNIVTAMFELAKTNQVIDPITIANQMKLLGFGEADAVLIGQITVGLPFFNSLESYIKIVKEKAVLRDLIKQCSNIISESLAEEQSAAELIEAAEKMVYALSDQTTEKQEFTPLGAIVEESLKEKRILAKQETHGTLGLATGLRDFDRLTSGLQKTDLIILAGRPGMAKTALSLTVAQNASASSNAVVAIFSLEMGKKQLGARMISSESKVDHHRYRTGFLLNDEWSRLDKSVGEIKGQNIFIDDSPSLTALEMRSRARRLKSKIGRLDLIVIDYLDLIKKLRTQGKHTELKDICVDLKQTAKLLDVPVLLIHQLNRECEKRNPPRPIMSDLREAGEEDADMVLLLYREEYYKKTGENSGVAELIIGKARNSPTGTVKLSFLDSFVKFENYFGDFGE